MTINSNDVTSCTNQLTVCNSTEYPIKTVSRKMVGCTKNRLWPFSQSLSSLALESRLAWMATASSTVSFEKRYGSRSVVSGLTTWYNSSTPQQDSSTSAMRSLETICTKGK
eukprot:m.113679 g.113679  ORF g.113679 m.113679 type:complete len:111 (-) comp12802_c1_seq1:176-508(-)